MTNRDFAKYKIPDTPGVYIFQGPIRKAQGQKNREEILYIGRATSLRDRVRSYFGNDLIQTRGPLLVDMITIATELKWQETDSVLEAIILEAKLIKTHQPYYNTKEKDNKSYYFVIITKEIYPRILIERGRTLDKKISDGTLSYDIAKQYGPFPNASILLESLKIVRKIFPYRDRCLPANKARSNKPCFHRQIGLCPGVCTGEITAGEYKKIIKHISLFFEGQKARLINSLTKEMDIHARAQEFEKAKYYRGMLHALTHIQDISLMKVESNSLARGFRIEAYDVAHISGTDTVGVMTVVIDGVVEKSEYRKFKIKHDLGAHEMASLQELLIRRLRHTEWPRPDMIVVDGNEVQLSRAQEILKKKEFFAYRDIPIVAVVKDHRHKARAILNLEGSDEILSRAILLANSEAHRYSLAYHRLLRLRNRGL